MDVGSLAETSPLITYTGKTTLGESVEPVNRGGEGKENTIE